MGPKDLFIGDKKKLKMSLVKMSEKYQKLSKLLQQFPRTSGLELRRKSKSSYEEPSWMKKSTPSSQERYAPNNAYQKDFSPQVHKLLANLPPRNMMQRRWNSSNTV